MSSAPRRVSSHDGAASGPKPQPAGAGSSTVIAHCAYFDVVRHDLAEPDAEARSVFTMAMPEWASVVAITESLDVVLVEQHRHGLDGRTLETPGGIVDLGESPAEAAIRELREETGYEGAAAVSLGWVHPNPALQDNRCHLFLVRGAQLTGTPENDAYEQTSAVLLPLREIRRALADGTISHALAVVALERALAVVVPERRETMRQALDLLVTMEEAQRVKVIELARRLKPGLTAEDIRNPHDFPDLDDPDWHYEDGVLTGIQAVRFALRGLSRDLGPDEEAPPEGRERSG